MQGSVLFSSLFVAAVTSSDSLHAGRLEEAELILYKGHYLMRERFTAIDLGGRMVWWDKLEDVLLIQRKYEKV